MVRRSGCHRERTGQLASYRRESLNTSHKARIGLLNDHSAASRTSGSVGMRLSQIQAADEDYARRLPSCNRPKRPPTLSTVPSRSDSLKSWGELCPTGLRNCPRSVVSGSDQHGTTTLRRDPGVHGR